MHAASDALSHGLHAWPTIILAMVMLMAIGPVDAADNLWTNGAANLQWNTVTANWTSPTVWSNANVDSAIFSATGVGTLTLQSPITARALQFNTVGYTLAGTGANILTLSAGGSSVLSVGEIQSNAAVTIGAVIAGSAGLTKTGAGTLTLTATNTFSGLTTVNDGTLDLGGGGTTGSVAGNILSESDLIFNRSNGAIYGGVLSGAGTVSKLGAGTLTLTGANTGTGLFTLTTGALQLGGGGTVGNLVADIANNSSLLFNRSNAATYSGAISGAGTLTKLGTNTLTLTGASTSAGVLTVNGGILDLGGGGATGSFAGTIVNNGAVHFNHSGGISHPGDISGSGSVLVSAGSVGFGGAFSHTGGTTINAGTTLQELQDGSIAGNVTNNGALSFANGAVSTYAGIISGSGQISQIGGPLTLTGDNTFSGATSIQIGSSLQLGNGGTTGSVAGNIAISSTHPTALIFNRSNGAIYAGVISGAGTVSKLGAGTLTLTGANTGTGLFTVTTGALQLGGGGTVGNLVADIANNSSLLFNRSNAATYSGAISGAGTLTNTVHLALVL